MGSKTFSAQKCMMLMCTGEKSTQVLEFFFTIRRTKTGVTLRHTTRTHANEVLIELSAGLFAQVTAVRECGRKKCHPKLLEEKMAVDGREGVVSYVPWLMREKIIRILKSEHQVCLAVCAWFNEAVAEDRKQRQKSVSCYSSLHVCVFFDLEITSSFPRVLAIVASQRRWGGVRRTSWTR